MLRAKTACTFSTSELWKVPWDLRRFAHFHFEMCFAPQRRALFEHRNFQKCSDVLFTFWLRNVLRAATTCRFWTFQLPKVLRTWCFLHMLTWKHASRHSGVHFFDIWIWTSRSAPDVTCASCHNGVQFSERTFRPSGATKHCKTVFRDFSTFSRTCIFFLLIFSLLWLFPPLLFHLSKVSEVWLLNFLQIVYLFGRDALKHLRCNLDVCPELMSRNQRIVQRGWLILIPHDDKVDVVSPFSILAIGGGGFWSLMMVGWYVLIMKITVFKVSFTCHRGLISPLGLAWIRNFPSTRIVSVMSQWWVWANVKVADNIFKSVSKGDPKISLPWWICFEYLIFKLRGILGKHHCNGATAICLGVDLVVGDNVHHLRGLRSRNGPERPIRAEAEPLRHAPSAGPNWWGELPPGSCSSSTRNSDYLGSAQLGSQLGLMWNTTSKYQYLQFPNHLQYHNICQNMPKWSWKSLLKNKSPEIYHQILVAQFQPSHRSRVPCLPRPAAARCKTYIWSVSTVSTLLMVSLI